MHRTIIVATAVWAALTVAFADGAETLSDDATKEKIASFVTWPSRLCGRATVDFWNEIKTNYPALFGVLHRIRVYRHSSDHLVLNQTVAQKYREFWAEDTEGIAEESEKYFVVQQRLLEGFLTAIQIEMAGL